MQHTVSCSVLFKGLIPGPMIRILVKQYFIFVDFSFHFLFNLTDRPIFSFRPYFK